MNIEDEFSDFNLHQENWEFYLSLVDDKIGSIVIDLGFYHLGPVEDHDKLVWVSVLLNEPTPEGFPEGEEAQILDRIEDAILDKLDDEVSALYVGRLTTDGKRDFYFYVEDASTTMKLIGEVFPAFPAHECELGYREDPDWEVYFEFLYPDPLQYQAIQNQKVVDQLVAAGDDLTSPRRVEHWLHFASIADSENFLRRIEPLNFSIVAKSFDDTSHEFPYKIHIARVDLVDIESVNDYTLDLWKTANECNGEYDGWETEVIA